MDDQRYLKAWAGELTDANRDDSERLRKYHQRESRNALDKDDRAFHRARAKALKNALEESENPL